ncbi:hypothetical protein N825_14690 [Skermanella stibiiresistens SB22]|uniref:Uncharacterized protein n=1 Tax=Skermanella stibiiresistens SB22 TaxID=1385369 RepID=W9H0J0_9PROT|nr:hypothetical protein N825_14690 [Skermanella stibiiresistens SB22]
MCETVPPHRRVGQIPRSVLRPLWTLLEAERAGSTIGSVEVAAVIRRAGRDPEFAERAADAHPDFWDIVDDIRAVLILEDRVQDARDHLGAAAAAGFMPHWLLDHLAASVAGLSASDPKAADLFVMLIAKHRPVAHTALEMLDRLGDRPETRRHVTGLIDRLAEDVRTRAFAAVPANAAADPRALETAVRDLLALRLTAGRLTLAKAPFDALADDLRDLVTGRFLATAAERVVRFVPTDRTDLRHPEGARLRAALAVFGRGRKLCGALGVQVFHDEALVALLADTAHRLALLDVLSHGLPADERQAARAAREDTLAAFLLVAPASAFQMSDEPIARSDAA